MEKDNEKMTEQPDLPSLSRDDLIKKINELNAKIDSLTNPPPNDWHSWFYSALEILLYRFRKDRVTIFPEVKLGAMPPIADFIIIKEDSIVDLGLEVFDFFRKYNIIEFKSPDDALSIHVLWKVIGYACFFINRDKIADDEITITLVRGAKPIKLFKELSSCGARIIDGSIKGPANGIYTIEGWKVDFPIRIIVSTELEGEKYAFFRTISRKPSVDDIKLIVYKAAQETNPVIRDFLREYLDKLSVLNRETLEEAKGRDKKVKNAWMDIFEPEISERVNTAVSSARADERANTTRTNLYDYVQDGGMTLDYAARRAGLTVDQFLTEMTSHGYHLPQGLQNM